MSLLPQRKKSPEEIAKLRESLGIPAVPPGEELASPPHGAPASAGSATLPSVEDAPPHGAPASAGSATLPSVEDAVTPAPLATPSGPKPVRSLKRSEQIPPSANLAPVAEPAVPVLSLKPFHSLRKSEQLPLPVTRLAEPPVDSNLPFHRHSDDELNDIRRRQALAMLSPVVNPKLVPAHPALIILGYVAVVAGAVTASLEPPAITTADLSWLRLFGHALAYDPRPLMVPVGCVAAALLVAACIVLYRPFSRHHAAFISVISLFVIIFGALHYFPQLRHGT
ncbi:MAG: hypothetical protein WCJ14_13965 [Verrucomicrobiota bacterium]